MAGIRSGDHRMVRGTHTFGAGSHRVERRPRAAAKRWAPAEPPSHRRPQRAVASYWQARAAALARPPQQARPLVADVLPAAGQASRLQCHLPPLQAADQPPPLRAAAQASHLHQEQPPLQAAAREPPAAAPSYPQRQRPPPPLPMAAASQAAGLLPQPLMVAVLAAVPAARFLGHHKVHTRQQTRRNCRFEWLTRNSRRWPLDVGLAHSCHLVWGG